MNRIDRLAFIYMSLAGACDAVTGLLLLFAPLATLRLMGIPDMPAEPIFTQWIGAFVCSVGLSYLMPFALRDMTVRRARALALFQFTALIRLVIGIFSAVAILRGELGIAWISVPLTDLPFAITQLLFLKYGAFQAERA